MASGDHKEEEQLLKELATKEVTIYLDARDRHGEWTLRIRKRNRRTGTISQVYASQLNVHLDLSEGDVVMSGSADCWLACSFPEIRPRGTSGSCLRIFGRPLAGG
jgi:hypothetical protein